MKKLRLNLLMLSVAAFALFFTACGGNETAKDKLSVTPEDLEFTAGDSEEQIVDVNTNVKSWSASTSSKWITISEGGADFSVTVENYTNTGASRTGRITVKAGEADPVTVTVTQLAAEVNTLSVSTNEINYAINETGNKTVTVTTNASSWEASESVDWISTAKQGSTLTVTVNSLNEGASTREANITLTAGSAPSVTVKVSQAVSITPPSFPEFPKSSYAANGTPDFLTTPGAKTWTGLATPSTSASQYYTITNFGDDNIDVRLIYSDGKTRIDGATKVVSNDTYNGYFRVCYINGDYIYIKGQDYVYYVNYNKATKMLDFSGTVEGFPAIVGVVALNKTTGAFGAVFTDLYKNLKLVLTPSASAPQPGNQSAVIATEFEQLNSSDIIVEKSGDIKIPLRLIRQAIQ